MYIIKMSQNVSLLYLQGVPPPAIKMKMSAEGLNPDYLDTPDAPAPAGRQTNNSSSESEAFTDSDSDQAYDEMLEFYIINKQLCDISQSISKSRHKAKVQVGYYICMRFMCQICNMETVNPILFLQKSSSD